MSSWETIFNDASFAPAPWTVALVPTAEISTATVDFSPLTWVSGYEPVGHAYSRIVCPINATVGAPEYANEELDTDELRSNVMSADLDDYYGLLNLSNRMFVATEDEVRKNFKQINLICHPDKADPSMRREAEYRFKAIQKAFDTFTDAQLKIEYDSNVDFDDSIPGPKDGTKSVEDFIATYYPVFERNARFSSVKPVPMLGDANSTEEEVNAFYNFWHSFKSWREFTHGDTERVGDSASRDERRRAAKKNAKVRETLKKEEMTRMRTFINRANDMDPRVKFFKTRAVENAKAAKAAAFAKKKAEEDARLQKIADEKAAKAAEEAAKKAAADAERLRKVKLETVTTRLRVGLARESVAADVVNKVVAALTVSSEKVLETDAALIAAGYTDAKGSLGKGISAIALVAAAMVN